MFSRETGLLLRMLGPLIEVICLVLLFSFPGEGRRIAGLTLARREVPSRPHDPEPADPLDDAR